MHSSPVRAWTPFAEYVLGIAKKERESCRDELLGTVELVLAEIILDGLANVLILIRNRRRH